MKDKEKILSEVCECAKIFYDDKYNVAIDDTLSKISIGMSDNSSIASLGKYINKESYELKYANAACRCIITDWDENKFESVILLPKVGEKKLFSLMAHEIFGHAMGNTYNVIEREADGMAVAINYGFTKSDLITKEVTDYYLSEAYALYVESEVCKIAGIKKDSEIEINRCAYNLGSVLLGEMSAYRDRIFDSYIYKDEKLTDIIGGDFEYNFNALRQYFDECRMLGIFTLNSNQTNYFNEHTKGLIKTYKKKK